MSAEPPITLARHQGRFALTEPEAKSLIERFGVKVPRSRLLASEEDVGAAVVVLRPPYALKVVSSSILHKSDVGGVRLALADRDAVCCALLDMRERLRGRMSEIDGFLLEEMSPGNLEFFIGGKVHPQFGPLLMVGLGGVFVEVLDDISIRLCPVDETEAIEMLRELRGGTILDGARGTVPVSREAIVSTILKIGGESGLLVRLADEVLELDINPLMVGPNSAIAVDARIILAR